MKLPAAVSSALIEKDVKDIAVFTESEAKLTEDLIKIHKPLKNVTAHVNTDLWQ